MAVGSRSRRCSFQLRWLIVVVIIIIIIIKILIISSTKLLLSVIDRLVLRVLCLELLNRLNLSMSLICPKGN